MSRKNLSLILVIGGFLLAVVSLLADVLGIGNRPGFGWKQFSGMTVGIIAVLVGIWMLFRKEEGK